MTLFEIAIVAIVWLALLLSLFLVIAYIISAFTGRDYKKHPLWGFFGEFSFFVVFFFPLGWLLFGETLIFGIIRKVTPSQSGAMMDFLSMTCDLIGATLGVCVHFSLWAIKKKAELSTLTIKQKFKLFWNFIQTTES